MLTLFCDTASPICLPGVARSGAPGDAPQGSLGTKISVSVDGLRVFGFRDVHRLRVRDWDSVRYHDAMQCIPCDTLLHPTILQLKYTLP